MRRAFRSGGPALDGKARGGNLVMQCVGVGGRGVEQPGEVGKRRAGELDLAAGLHGDREPPGSGSAGDDGSRATGQCLPSAAASVAAVSLPEDGGRTSHSSSTPMRRGGPCLKQTDAT